MIKIASVILYCGLAYLPTAAETDGGPFIQVKPVFQAELTVDALARTLAHVVEAGHPRIPPLSGADWKRRKDPVLAATGARSWGKLAKRGASYGITWAHDAVTFYLSRVDEKGRFAAGTDDALIFPPDTSLYIIADEILKDARLHIDAFTL